MVETLEPGTSEKLSELPLSALAGNRKPSISHIEDPRRSGKALCGKKLKNNPAGMSDPCVVCIEMKQYGRFAGR